MHQWQTLLLSLFNFVSVWSSYAVEGMAAPDNDEISYFGYGSNLWLQQMKMRCPDSKYLGVGRLHDYRWMINSRGFANIADSTKDEVYALVYGLTPADEQELDVYEGVPDCYTKESLLVDFWPSKDGRWVNVTDASKATKKEMYVYIDRNRTVDSKPKKEYIYRMNMGIKDAIEMGVPQTYVDTALRQFIPSLGECPMRNAVAQEVLVMEDER